MASSTDICNRALQKIGAARITSLNDQSTNARACNACYDTVRLALLRSHPWNFSVQRFQLAASDPAPLFGPSNSFPFPIGGLRPLPPDPAQNLNTRDWIVEGRAILTNDAAPLNARFVMDITDTSLFDALFAEALAAKIGAEICQQLTQSNSKKADCVSDFKMAIAEAKKTNAIEKVPQIAVDGTWITSRLCNPPNPWGSN